MYKRWEGNSGLVRHVGEPAQSPEPPSRDTPDASAGDRKGRNYAPPPSPSRAPGLFGGLDALLPGLRRDLETEDLLLGLILYLLYRESGETEWLIALGAMLLFD